MGTQPRHDPTLRVRLVQQGVWNMPLASMPLVTTLYYKVGFSAHAGSTNHEETAHYVGRDERELAGAASRV